MNNRTVEVAQSAPNTGLPRHQGHGWMMIGCGAMVGLAIVLVVTGAVSASFLVVALGCTAMMAVMMLMMSRGMGGSDHRSND